MLTAAVAVLAMALSFVQCSDDETDEKPKTDTMEIISNEKFRIAVSPVGAEMQSFEILATGRELLWQGDAQYWSGRSPILFPAVGGLWNQTYRLDGKEYTMTKHGFLRDKTWNVVNRAADSVTFEYREGEGNAMFPWGYAVRVTYALTDEGVEARFEVENHGDSEMFFQMGGHPGFALPDFDEDAAVDGYLELQGAPDHVLRAATQGCTLPEHFAFPTTADGDVPLCVETFANEALIFEGDQVTGVVVKDKQRRPIVEVKSTAPVWLFWSPQGVHSPFVCAEPWYGLCDPIGFEGDVSERPYVQHLSPGAPAWTGGYTIRVLCE